MAWQRYPDLPEIVALPTSDGAFADAVGVVVAGSPWIDRPEDLEDALRPFFDDVRVRASERGSVGTWYVDRLAGARGDLA